MNQRINASIKVTIFKQDYSFLNSARRLLRKLLFSEIGAAKPMAKTAEPTCKFDTKKHKETLLHDLSVDRPLQCHETEHAAVKSAGQSMST